MTSTKKIQIKETKKELQNYLTNGCVLVSLNQYKNIFKKYGFKVCLDKKNYLLKYYNTSNVQKYLVATTTLIDNQGYSYCNINSNWYKKHVIQGQRQLTEYKNFIKDKNTYITVLKSGHILSI